MSDFKVGDKVICINDTGLKTKIKKGSEYTVKDNGPYLRLEEVVGLFFPERFIAGVSPWALKEALARCGLNASFGKVPKSVEALARMIEKYETPPVSPEILAARQHYSLWHPESAANAEIIDRSAIVTCFLAGVEWVRKNNPE